MAIKDSEGDYARILRRIVDDPDYGAHSPVAKLVWLTMLLAPEFKLLGIATADASVFARRTGFTAKQVERAFSELVAAEVIRRDGPWVWIRNHLRFQENSESWAKSDTTMAGLSKRLNNLPTGISFLPEFVQMYGSLGFKFDLSPRLRIIIDRGIGTPIGTRVDTRVDNPEPETPEPETPETPYTPEYPKETVAVVAIVPAASPLATDPGERSKPDSFTLFARRYVGCFNAVFTRRASASPEVVERIKARIRSKYNPAHLVALPIMVEAQGVSSEMRKELNPLMLLRDGKRPRTGGDGRTYGATDWLERALNRMDQTSLDERLAHVAQEFEVINELLRLGASIRREIA